MIERDRWGWAKNSFRKHYFVDGFSLCGRYHQTDEWDWSDMNMGKCTRCLKKAAMLDITRGHNNE